MRAIFGLGNPGSEYESTRHNIGFDVLDALAVSLHVRFSPGRGDYLAARVRMNDDVLLVKPLTCMNNSGLAVREIVVENRIPLQDTLTVVDDFELPLGKLRLRNKGSAGGHNGLASIVWALASDEFPRLRCGIGSDERPRDKRKTAEFVLSTFEKHEQPAVAAMVQRAKDIAMMFGHDSVRKAVDILSRQS